MTKINVEIDDELSAWMREKKQKTGVPIGHQVRASLRATMLAERPRGPFPRPDETENEEY